MQQFREMPTTNAPSSVKDVWQDHVGGLWLRSIDGDLVVVSYKNLQRFKDIVLKAVKYVPPLKIQEATT